MIRVSSFITPPCAGLYRVTSPCRSPNRLSHSLLLTLPLFYSTIASLHFTYHLIVSPSSYYSRIDTIRAVFVLSLHASPLTETLPPVANSSAPTSAHTSIRHELRLHSGPVTVLSLLAAWHTPQRLHHPMHRGDAAPPLFCARPRLATAPYHPRPFATTVPTRAQRRRRS